MRAAVLSLLISLAASQAVYQRPNNSDCVASSQISNPTNFFPGKYQVGGLDTTLQQDNRVNVSWQAEQQGVFDVA